MPQVSGLIQGNLTPTAAQPPAGGLHAMATADQPQHAIQLSMAQRFEIERLSRALDATTDVATLQAMAKQLLQAWQTQRAATQWVMRQQLHRPLSPEAAARLIPPPLRGQEAA
jgi:hypothetical protein